MPKRRVSKKRIGRKKERFAKGVEKLGVVARERKKTANNIARYVDNVLNYVKAYPFESRRGKPIIFFIGEGASLFFEIAKKVALDYGLQKTQIRHLAIGRKTFWVPKPVHPKKIIESKTKGLGKKRQILLVDTVVDRGNVMTNIGEIFHNLGFENLEYHASYNLQEGLDLGHIKHANMPLEKNEMFKAIDRDYKRGEATVSEKKGKLVTKIDKTKIASDTYKRGRTAFSQRLADNRFITRELAIEKLLQGLKAKKKRK